MEYEDCVIDTGSDKLEFFMPTWPTLWPGLADGKTNVRFDTRDTQLTLWENEEIDSNREHFGLSERQKQLLYECEEERMVTKACFRELLKLKRNRKHTSWDTAEAANMAFM